MKKFQTRFAGPVKILALTIVPSSFFVTVPAFAETRAGVDVSVSGKVASNPFLEVGGSAGVAGELNISPWLQIIDDVSSVDLRGSFGGSAYTSGHGTDTSALVQLDIQREMSPYFSIREGVHYSNSNAGIQNDLISRTVPADNVPPPVALVPDTTFVGIRTRTELLDGRVGFTLKPSPIDSLSVDLGASQSRFSEVAGTNYNYYSATLGYTRTLSEHTSATADILVAKSDYIDTQVGDGTIITPRLGLQRQFNRTLTVSVNLGASFSQTRRIDGSHDNFTMFSGAVRLCNSSDRSVLCFNASRSAQPRAIGGITAVTSVDLSFDRQLSLRDNLTLTAVYSKNDESALLGGASKYYGVSGSVSHSFNRRLFAFASPSYSRATGDLRTPTRQLPAISRTAISLWSSIMNVSANLDESEGGGGGFLAHVPAILWQRRWFVIVPVILGLIAALFANLLIPATYRSSALMLVQSPQLSGSIIDDATEVVDRRIARIAEQITSRPDLVALIEKHGLYKNVRGSKPLSEILDDMRDAIKLTPTGSDLSGANPNDRTIAFRLSFDYGEPTPTQAVALDLMQRIIELDASGNSEQATRRVEFLGEQARGLEQQIGELQGKIATINAQNGGILANTGIMMGGSSGSYDVQIAALQRDNANLISQRDTARKSDNRDPVVVAAETQLASARAVYSENHPDVVIAKQRLAEARELAKSNTSKLPLDAIDQQIAFNNSQISALRSAKAQETSQVSSARAAQSRAPLIQSQLVDLQQQLSRLNDQYKEVSTKLFAARAGVRADDEQMGERLTVVDPPVIPDTPVWPDRLLISAAGIVGGLGLGLFLALAVELLLGPIRDPAALAGIVGSAPLAMIPVIGKRDEAKAKQGRWPIIGRLWSKSR